MTTGARRQLRLTLLTNWFLASPLRRRVSYTKFGGEWKNTVAEDNAWGGIVRFQRSF